MILFRNKRSFRASHYTTMAELRVQKDIAELAEQRSCSRSCYVHISPLQRDFPLLRVFVSLAVKADCGHLYAGAVFQAVIVFGEKYPFVPPDVLVLNRVYHPNVDIDSGEVCLSLLSPANWKPVITLSSIILAMELTLLNPDLCTLPANPVNHDMATLCKQQSPEFALRVRTSLAGGSVGDYQFDCDYGQLATLKRKREAECYQRIAMVKVAGYEPMHVEVDRCA